MQKRNINRSLRARVRRLEGEMGASDEPSFRLGYVVQQLPQDYTGERHLAVRRVVGRDDNGREWSEVEERPGPAPRGSAERLPQVCFTETDMKICFGPDFVWGVVRADPRRRQTRADSPANRRPIAMKSR